MRYIELLQDRLNELENYFPNRDVEVNQISKASVGWHLDHSFKVFEKVSDVLINSDASKYKWQFNFWRTYCFLVNGFPRGKAKAPKAVRPKDEISKESLQNQLQECENRVEELSSLPANANFKHPIFGYLNKKQSLKFLNLHTEHHLKIIRDILEENQKSLN